MRHTLIFDDESNDNDMKLFYLEDGRPTDMTKLTDTQKKHIVTLFYSAASVMRNLVDEVESKKKLN